MIFDGRYLNGAVKIAVKGAMPERFINLCMDERINLWGVTRQEDGLVAWISLRNFFKIRSLARKSRTQIKVLSFFGLPFAVKKAKGRKMMVAGSLLFLLALYVLSSCVWFIEIKGLKSLPADKISQIAAANGLKRASLKDKADIKKIEKEILLNIPEISWVGVNFNGTQAIIEVVEKTMPKEENKAPANIIALKDGVIEEIIVLAGQAAVQKGATVKKGDILIKGTLPGAAALLQGADKPGTAKPAALPEEVRAKGIVKAKVWYESYAETKRIRVIPVRTGNKQAKVALKFGGREFNIKPAAENPFAEYEIQTVRKEFDLWRNSNFSVEIIINNYLEIITHNEEIPLAEAGEEAKLKALGAVQANIAQNAQILSRNFEVISAAHDIVRVKASVNTIEDIGGTADIK